jgi:hypothetical protein
VLSRVREQPPDVLGEPCLHALHESMRRATAGQAMFRI